MTGDAEYQRLLRLRTLAKDRGELEAALAYGNAALRRGDELLGGKPLFGPLANLIEELIAHNSAQLRK